MAVKNRNRHYVPHDIHRWHWVAMGKQLGGFTDLAWLESLPDEVLGALERVALRLPEGFPAPLFEVVAQGIRQAARRLASEPDQGV